MKTSFDTWLAELASAGRGGSALASDDVPIATRGLAWSMIVALAGDWTTATLAGSVSAAPDAASPLATFTVSSASYSSVTGYTTWTLSLASGTGSNSTGALPPEGVRRIMKGKYSTPSPSVSVGSANTLIGGALSVVGKD